MLFIWPFRRTTDRLMCKSRSICPECSCGRVWCSAAAWEYLQDCCTIRDEKDQSEDVGASFLGWNWAKASVFWVETLKQVEIHLLLWDHERWRRSKFLCSKQSHLARRTFTKTKTPPRSFTLIGVIILTHHLKTVRVEESSGDRWGYREQVWVGGSRNWLKTRKLVVRRK